MTLGELIKFLETLDPNFVARIGITDPHSYRGYYEDLAFEPDFNVYASSMLSDARESLGKTFVGYKGGEYEMGEHTDVWLSFYGRSDSVRLTRTFLAAMFGDPTLIDSALHADLEDLGMELPDQPPVLPREEGGGS